ncbi:hypothetical protein ACRAWF_00995 [Streptomyces sp. L7]
MLARGGEYSAPGAEGTADGDAQIRLTVAGPARGRPRSRGAAPRAATCWSPRPPARPWPRGLALASAVSADPAAPERSRESGAPIVLYAGVERLGLSAARSASRR